MFAQKNKSSHCIFMALICLLALYVGQVNAVWYEAKGQAIIMKGDKHSARKAATEEALKQALLFAGASINSVQQLTNGLLESEDITISSTGEVNQVELVDEVWHSDYVTVTIRADIFPKEQICKASEYTKQVASSYFSVANREHLLDGQIADFPAAFTRHLATLMDTHGTHAKLSYIAPYTTYWSPSTLPANVRELAKVADAQFVLVGEITDLSVTREPPSRLAFWADEDATRYFAFDVAVYDGLNGGKLFQRTYQTQDTWPFDRFAELDEYSQSFWSTAYGKAIDKQVAKFIVDLEETTSCQPLTGRVLQANNTNVTVSLGRDNGVMPNDELYIYQTRQFTDGRGETFIQYNIYPGVFIVESAYSNSAQVRHKDANVIINIQENDFVIKK